MVARKRRLLTILGLVVVTVAAFVFIPRWAAQSTPSPYRLPWAAGPTNRERVIQGMHRTDLSGQCISGCSTHADKSEGYAIDFGLPEGTQVLAARAGRVSLVSSAWPADHCGGLVPIKDPPPGYVVSPTIGNETNFVEIDQGDGTSALYLHLSTVASAIEMKARLGESVVQGEVLGLSGRTGYTMCHPHLHFQVEKTAKADWFTDSVPVRFSDSDVVSRTADGVPVEGQSYLSDNVPVTGSP